MKKILCLIIMCVPLLISAQETSGIQFTTGLMWSQIKQKAKSENKYIFLDCFTTWCGPCKMMDASVYSNDSVGDYFNQHFISVKVQLDKTKKDNEQIKSWYDDAAAIGKEYHVEAYPTFIFLSPDGVIVNKDLGLKGIKDFIAIAQTATMPGHIYDDPYKNYDTLAAAYMQGKRDYESYPLMIKMAFKSNDTAFGNKLIKEFSDYAITLKSEKRYTKERIEMWADFSWRSNTRVFQFFYKDEKLIDRVMKRKGYAAKVVDATITGEIVNPFLEQQAEGSGVAMDGGYLTEISGEHLLKMDTREADWKKLDKMISGKYTAAYVKRNLLSARIEWYKRHFNYPAAAKYSLMYLNKYSSLGSENPYSVNSIAFNAFKYSTDKKTLQGFVKWMEKLLKKKSDETYFMDTYANLLYKTGRKLEAILWEGKAMKASSGNLSASYKAVIEQMKRGEPTYGAVWQ